MLIDPSSAEWVSGKKGPFVLIEPSSAEWVSRYEGPSGFSFSASCRSSFLLLDCFASLVILLSLSNVNEVISKPLPVVLIESSSAG